VDSCTEMRPLYAYLTMQYALSTLLGNDCAGNKVGLQLEYIFKGLSLAFSRSRPFDKGLASASLS